MGTCAPEHFDAIIAAPGFSLGLCCNAHAVTRIHFLAPRPTKPPALPLAVEAARQLHAWLADVRFAFDLPLAPQGTPFQLRVWTQISAIALGKTSSYAELAQAINSAPRAVGGACGANPLPIVVPCHRVIASDGSLGGFSRAKGGFFLEIKRWLLAREVSCRPQ
jgi:methylated-DNA-[protein]-cysteine S-methyltransferase